MTYPNDAHSENMAHLVIDAARPRRGLLRGAFVMFGLLLLATTVSIALAQPAFAMAGHGLHVHHFAAPTERSFAASAKLETAPVPHAIHASAHQSHHADHADSLPEVVPSSTATACERHCSELRANAGPAAAAHGFIARIPCCADGASGCAASVALNAAAELRHFGLRQSLRLTLSAFPLDGCDPLPALPPPRG